MHVKNVNIALTDQASNPFWGENLIEFNFISMRLISVLRNALPCPAHLLLLFGEPNAEKALASTRNCSRAVNMIYNNVLLHA